MLNVINPGVNIDKHLALSSNAISGIMHINASGDISGGSITTHTGHISSTSGKQPTINGTIACKNLSCQHLPCAGTDGKTTTPTSAGVHMGMDSCAVGGIDICSAQLQYVDFNAASFDYGRRLLYEYNLSPATHECQMECSGKRFKSYYEINGAWSIYARQHRVIKYLNISAHILLTQWSK